MLCGDFLQLPPVGLGNSTVTEHFAFESPTWAALGIKTEHLTDVIRQASDPTFIQLLQAVRLGVLSPTDAAVLQQCHIQAKPKPNDGVLPTKVMCVNGKVNAVNAARLHKLPGTEVAIVAMDRVMRRGQFEGATEQLTRAVEKMAPATIQLKIGAQVVLLVNLDVRAGLVNGSRGVIEKFEDVATHKLDDKIEPYYVDYYMDSERDPEENLDEISEQSVRCAVVRFDCGERRVIQPWIFRYQTVRAGTMVRLQAPLKLAWAITVHKSQGMTLSRAEIEVDDAFDYGQVYVALSRCVSLEGLWISGGNIDQHSVKANPTVRLVQFLSRQNVICCGCLAAVYVISRGSEAKMRKGPERKSRA